MSHTETMDQINYVGGVFGKLSVGVLGMRMGAPESAWGHSGTKKHIIIDPEPPNMMVVSIVH